MLCRGPALLGAQPREEGEELLERISYCPRRVGTPCREGGEQGEGFPEGVAFSPFFFVPCPSLLSSQSHQRRGCLMQRVPHTRSHSPSLGTQTHLLGATLSPSPSRSLPTGEGNSALSPLNPGELLIALHNIDSVKCDMKSIIKGEALPPVPPKWPGCCGPREEPQSLTCPRWSLPRWRLCHLQPHLRSGHLPSFLCLPSLLSFLPPSVQGTGASAMHWPRVVLKKGGGPLPPQPWLEE